jgi:hypothetical protein
LALSLRSDPSAETEPINELAMEQAINQVNCSQTTNNTYIILEQATTPI